MAELFSPEWMQAFGEQWNAEPELADALAKINFNSTIGYGFDNDTQPMGVINIENGRVVAAGKYKGQELNWDLRADRQHWEQWKTKGLLTSCTSTYQLLEMTLDRFHSEVLQGFQALITRFKIVLKYWCKM